MKKLYVKADAMIYRRKSCNSVNSTYSRHREDVLMTDPDYMSHDSLSDNYRSYAMGQYTQAAAGA